MGFPGGSEVKNPPAKQETQETWIRSLGWGDPLVHPKISFCTPLTSCHTCPLLVPHVAIDMNLVNSASTVVSG